MVGPGLGMFGSFGVGQYPDAPVITGAVDGGDQDSVVVSITGTDTVRLYYRLLNAASWTTGLTRNGSGDITQTGLTAGQWYEFYCVADVSGAISAPSNLVTVLVITATETIETALYALLTGDGTLTSLVSARIFPVLVPQGTTMPAVTYAQVSGGRVHATDGPAGLVNSRWQFNCWGVSNASARAVSDALRQAIDGYSGTTGGVTIQAIQTEMEVNIEANPAGINRARRYGKALDFNVWFEEAA